jgi:PKD repeat protein
MKKILLLTALSIGSLTFAQNNWCGSDKHMNEVFNQNPEFETQMYERFSRIGNGQLGPEERVDDIVIPVVVHVIHDNEEGDISMAQIHSAIEMLNEDFKRTNTDAANTRNTADAPFSPIASDMGITFALAKVDPQGNCTNGVQRRNSAAGSYDGNDDKSKYYSGGGLNAWPRGEYFNIWVVNSIENDEPGTILGYAQFPYWGSANTYGVIIRHDAFGKIGTANGDRTITHEIGHCFGLPHTFQSGCGSNASDCFSQGDGCCDTPPVDEAHWSCNQSQNNCSQVPTDDFYGFDALDQFENYMSYSPCQNMFSMDQESIVLTNLSDIGYLSNLVSLSNQNDKGLNSPDILCQADFTSSTTVICQGSTIDFSDLSFNDVDTRSWTFEGGTASSDSDSLTTVTYNTAGTFDVTIQVSDGLSTKTKTLTDYVTVMPDPGVALPYLESFETVSFPDNYNFFIENNDAGQTWQSTTTAAKTGSKSVMIRNYSADGGTRDAFISGPIDLSVLDDSEEVLLTFEYAYRKKSSSNDEWIRVYVSNDCGESWSLRKNIHGNSLSEETFSTSYLPEQDEWNFVEITNISDTYHVPNFRYKIEFEGDDGNNIFIDDINIYPESWLGTEENNIENKFSVYPNPTTNTSTLNYFSNSTDEVNIVVYNVVGEKIATVFNGNVQTGNNSFTIELADYPKGIYFVNITDNSGMKTVKLIKE